MQRIANYLGDNGVRWRSGRVREFLEVAVSKGWCRRVPIRRPSDDRRSTLCFADPYRAIRWFKANPGWAAQQAEGLAGRSAFRRKRSTHAVREPPCTRSTTGSSP